MKLLQKAIIIKLKVNHISSIKCLYSEMLKVHMHSATKSYDLKNKIKVNGLNWVKGH